MQDISIPLPVRGLYESKLQDFITKRCMHLQCCPDCKLYCYPAAPGCPNCFNMDLKWLPLSGRGTILSWAIFHKQYIPAYPVPYNVIAVRLDEGPIMISNLEGPQPEGSWIGLPVTLVYVEVTGIVLPRFKLPVAESLLERHP